MPLLSTAGAIITALLLAAGALLFIGPTLTGISGLTSGQGKKDPIDENDEPTSFEEHIKNQIENYERTIEILKGEIDADQIESQV